MLEGKNNRQVRKGIDMLNVTTLGAIGDESGSKDKNQLMQRSGFEYYDSYIESYEKDFEEVLFPYESFNEFLKRNYSERLGELVGIELGGPGINFFKGIEWDIFKKTAGFTLKKLPEHMDNSNHEVVEADVFSKEKSARTWYLYSQFAVRNILKGKDDKSWQQVLDWAKTNGRPDFIIERMVGPLFEIRNARLFMLILDRWYRILNDEGSMFIEVPRNFKKEVLKGERIDYNLVKLLLESVKRKSKNIVLESSDMSDLSRFREGRLVIHIRKLKGAPKTLRELV